MGLSLQRAFLDGTRREVVVGAEFVAEPTDVIVDPASRMIYWADAKKDGIYRLVPTSWRGSPIKPLHPESNFGDLGSVPTAAFQSW